MMGLQLITSADIKRGLALVDDELQAEELETTMTDNKVADTITHWVSNNSN